MKKALNLLGENSPAEKGRAAVSGRGEAFWSKRRSGAFLRHEKRKNDASGRGQGGGKGNATEEFGFAR